MKFYNRNGWGIEALEEERNGESNIEIKIVEREREQQRQWEQNGIDRSKYNKRYKEIKVKEEDPKYLQRVNLNKLRMGKGVRALIKLRCGNLKEENKYWQRIGISFVYFVEKSEIT